MTLAPGKRVSIAEDAEVMPSAKGLVVQLDIETNSTLIRLDDGTTKWWAENGVVPDFEQEQPPTAPQGQEPKDTTSWEAWEDKKRREQAEVQRLRRHRWQRAAFRLVPGYLLRQRLLD